MAPIHVKPPYATDESDSYESAPISQRRVRQLPPNNPNDRTSAYDVYNSYLDDDKAASRQSGVGALGLGLLNMDDDDDDDEDDNAKLKAPVDSKPTAIPTAPAVSTSKLAALAAATAAAKAGNNIPPQNILAPKPGYPAPIAALNNLARPEAAASFQTRAPPVSEINNTSQTSLRNPFADPNPSPISREHHPHDVATSPSPSVVSNSPHPLQPPMTPITPVFARPGKPGIKFADAANDRSKPILRGDSEGTLLPNRGEKGDDFWRRFSMVAKEESRKSNSQKTSLWLKKTQDGSTRLSRWVWVIGIILLAIIGGAIGIGWYVSHKSPAHQQPKAFGGSANEAATASSSSTMATVGPAGSTIRHVSATHTVDRRSAIPVSTAAPRLRHPQQRRLYGHQMR